MSSKVTAVWAPIVFLFLMIVVGELSPKGFSISPILLPSPSAIFQAGLKNFSELFFAGFNSFIIAISGFILSLIFGTAIA